MGIIKCKIKIFRKEDETISGKAKADTTRDPCFYEVGPDDPSIADALEFASPYRQYNIYETYPEAVVEVRAYCLKAFQVTPGIALSKSDDGEPEYFHFLNAYLGDETKQSQVVKSLSPNFFWVGVFKDCTIPGPSQLTLELNDGKVSGGQVGYTRVVGRTVIDLEDRWFCQNWRDVKFKPREVRDLVNEEEKAATKIQAIHRGNQSRQETTAKLVAQQGETEEAGGLRNRGAPLAVQGGLQGL